MADIVILPHRQQLLDMIKLLLVTCIINPEARYRPIRSQKLQLGGSFIQNCGPFQQNSRLFNKFVVFSNKIVDLFGKIVDLLFERGVLPHLENPPGYGPEV